MEKSRSTLVRPCWPPAPGQGGGPQRCPSGASSPFSTNLATEPQDQDFGDPVSPRIHKAMAHPRSLDRSLPRLEGHILGPSPACRLPFSPSPPDLTEHEQTACRCFHRNPVAPRETECFRAEECAAFSESRGLFHRPEVDTRLFPTILADIHGERCPRHEGISSSPPAEVSAATSLVLQTEQSRRGLRGRIGRRCWERTWGRRRKTVQDASRPPPPGRGCAPRAAVLSAVLPSVRVSLSLHLLQTLQLFQWQLDKLLTSS